MAPRERDSGRLSLWLHFSIIWKEIVHMNPYCSDKGNKQTNKESSGHAELSINYLMLYALGIKSYNASSHCLTLLPSSRLSVTGSRTEVTSWEVDRMGLDGRRWYVEVGKCWETSQWGIVSQTALLSELPAVPAQEITGLSSILISLAQPRVFTPAPGCISWLRG